jgi:FdhD protein
VSSGSTEVCFDRYESGQRRSVSRPVAHEALITMYVNDTEWVTFLCTPLDLGHLAVGFLHSEGLIADPADIALLRVCDEDEGEIHARLLKPVSLPTRRVLTSGCGGGITFTDLAARREPLSSSRSVSPSQIAESMLQLYRGGEIHDRAGGVHTSALSDGRELYMVSEDVGRHNTLDKILGRSLLTGLSTAGKILVTTGRISSEMLGKAAHMRVPIVISRTSPTDLAIELAREWRMTLIGYVRGRNFNIYSGEWRVLGEVGHDGEAEHV